jgi:hypothetical protein
MRKNASKLGFFASFMAVVLLGLVVGIVYNAESSEKTQKPGKKITVGDFSLSVPTDWKNFSSGESDSLRRQFLAQQKEIFKQFDGSDIPSKTLNVAAFHLSGNAGSFVVVISSIPPQSNLIKTLRNEVDEKMSWGVREGFIRKYLGVVSVDNEKVSGFYTKAIGKEGNVQVSGGLEPKNKKNTIIQLTLLCPKNWNEAKATSTLSSILESVNLGK